MLEDHSDQISAELSAIIKHLSEGPQPFWEAFICNIASLSPLIVDPLVKLGLRTHGAPQGGVLERARSVLGGCKYVLSFYSNEEISENLPRFL